MQHLHCLLRYQPTLLLFLIKSNLNIYCSSTNMYLKLCTKMILLSILFGAEIFGSGRLILFDIPQWQLPLSGILKNYSNLTVKCLCGLSMSCGQQINTGRFRSDLDSITLSIKHQSVLYSWPCHQTGSLLVLFYLQIKQSFHCLALRKGIQYFLSWQAFLRT